MPGTLLVTRRWLPPGDSRATSASWLTSASLDSGGHTADAGPMLCARSFRARLFALGLLAATLLVALPLPVHHQADHPDEATHLERHHGGHGGLLEQDEARIPAPYGPVAVTTVARELPETLRIVRSRPASDDFLIPLGRAPPPDLPRAPPSSS